MTDEALLEAWRGGDARAGQTLLERYFKPLYRFFANKVDHEADELIQRTMLATVRGRDQFRGQSSFRSYLFVIARHELHRFYRDRRRDRLVFDPEQSSVFELTQSPSTLAAKRQEQQLLLEALRRLPIELQTALELHYWEELSTAELAEALEIPQGTVKSRLRRARERLEQEIAKLVADPEQQRATLDQLDGLGEQLRSR